MERTKRFINILAFTLVFLPISCTQAPTPVAAQAPATAPAPVAVVVPASTGTAELDRTIKLASDDMNTELPSGSKVALLNFNSASDAFSDYVIEEMSVNLVRGKKLVVVDRKEIDLIRSEMKFQMSGEVSDESIQTIGKKLGAQFIVSGSLTSLGDSYRFRIKVINVNSAAVETSSSAILNDSPQIQHMLTQGKTSIPQATIAKTAAPSAVVAATSSIQGTIVPGASLAEKLAWLQRSADSHNTYILEVTADENIAPHVFEYKGAINITIVLKGIGANRTIKLQSHGTMFTVRPNVTLILENNITLHGHNPNTGFLVYVDGGIFKMRTGSTITGNIKKIEDWHGGGVHILSGTFEMTGGTIYGNTGHSGGGVYVGGVGGSFTMSGGTISNNTSRVGGGVCIIEGGNFTMTGGIISSNIAWVGGGGVYTWKSKETAFNMHGGTIMGNTAREVGGGVFIDGVSFFNKIGGTIAGYNSDQSNGNVVKDEAGNVLARKGHAVLGGDRNTRKETTAGPSTNLSYENGKSSGAWDQ